MRRPPFGAVLFDLDGVLIDSEPVSIRAMQDAARRFGFDVPDEAMPSFKGLPGQIVYGRVALEYGAGLVDAVTLRSARDAIYDAWLPDIPAMPGAVDLVRSLHADGVRCALVTSSRRRQGLAALESIGVRDLFDVVLGSEDVAQPKPAPQPYLEAARAVAISPEQCVVVEDSLAGVQSGVAAGCRVVGYPSSFTADELRAAGAHLVLETHGEIGRFVLG